MPFQPGQSGNPKGRPKKGRSMTEALEAAVTPRARRKIAKLVLEKALAGDPWAIAFLFDRIDGRAPLRIDIAERVREFAREAGLSDDDVEEAVLTAEGIVREAQVR